MQNQLQLLSVTSLGDRLDSTLCGLFVIPYHKTFTEKKFCPTTAYKTTLPGGCSSCLSLQACHNGVAFLRIISIIKLIFFFMTAKCKFLHTIIIHIMHAGSISVHHVLLRQSLFKSRQLKCCWKPSKIIR